MTEYGSLEDVAAKSKTPQAPAQKREKQISKVEIQIQNYITVFSFLLRSLFLKTLMVRVD